jgi:hypothetical protein
MTRNEVVRLVSRAIAVIQFITALIEVTYLPSRMYSVHHYAGLGASTYLQMSYSLDVSVLFLRIAGLLILTWVFWNCGPWISRMLLPVEISDGPDGASSGGTLNTSVSNPSLGG